jgi:DNA-binding protein HU-beta
MIKADIINQVSSKAGISKAAADKALMAFIDGVTAALKKGEKVSLVGFGTFRVGKRAARKGRNPQTGKEITIKASKVPKFKAGKALKDAVKR